MTARGSEEGIRNSRRQLRKSFQTAGRLLPQPGAASPGGAPWRACRRMAWARRRHQITRLPPSHCRRNSSFCLCHESFGAFRTTSSIGLPWRHLPGLPCCRAAIALGRCRAENQSLFKPLNCHHFVRFSKCRAVEDRGAGNFPFKPPIPVSSAIAESHRFRRPAIGSRHFKRERSDQSRRGRHEEAAQLQRSSALAGSS